MILSHGRKFIFFAAGRTGTTSIESRLASYGSDFGLSDAEWQTFNKHMPPAILRRRLPCEMWDSYWKIAFVRNPWDWMISRYFHDKRTQQEPMSSPPRITEEDILRLCRMKGVMRGIEWAEYRHQFAFLSDEAGNLQVDFVGRFENLQGDFDTICDRLSIPRSALPKLNGLTHEPYETYYTKSTMDLVGQLYRKDVEFFGYKFGS